MLFVYPQPAGHFMRVQGGQAGTRFGSGRLTGTHIEADVRHRALGKALDSGCRMRTYSYKDTSWDIRGTSQAPTGLP